MALTQRLDLRQTQALVMTPQLQQAIKLLQLSNVELAAYVDAELEQNPLLERDEARPSPRRAAAESPRRPRPANPEDATPSRPAERRRSWTSRLRDGRPVQTEAVEMWHEGAGSRGRGRQSITPATPMPGRRAAPPRAPDREPARATIARASTRRWRATADLARASARPARGRAARPRRPADRDRT